MELVKFIQEFKVDELKEPLHVEIVNDCLERLHEFYGYDLHEWMFDVLNERSKEENYPIDEILDSIHASIHNITFDILVKYHRDDGLYVYKGRELFRFRGKIVVDDEVFIHSLFNVLSYFVEKEKQTEQRWIQVLRLYEQIPTIRLLKGLNLNFIAEEFRHFDHEKVDKKNEDYDEKPLNKERMKVVQDLAFTFLYVNEDSTIKDCIQTIKKDVEQQLHALYNAGKLSTTDGDYLPIPPKAFHRWVSEIHLALNKTEEG